MDKKQYSVPLAEIVKFDAEDVITTSGAGTGGSGTGGGFFGEWDTDIPEIDL